MLASWVSFRLDRRVLFYISALAGGAEFYNCDYFRCLHYFTGDIHTDDSQKVLDLWIFEFVFNPPVLGCQR